MVLIIESLFSIQHNDHQRDWLSGTATGFCPRIKANSEETCAGSAEGAVIIRFSQFIWSWEVHKSMYSYPGWSNNY